MKNKRNMTKSQIRRHVTSRRLRFLILSAVVSSSVLACASRFQLIPSGLLTTLLHAVMLLAFWGANYWHCKWNFRHIHPHQRRYRYGTLAYLMFMVVTTGLFFVLKQPVFSWILEISATFALLIGGAGEWKLLLSLGVFHVLSLVLIGFLPLVIQKKRREHRRRHTA